MIPQNIRKEHIISALDEIRNKGVPKGRDSKKYKLISDGQPFPPKYVVSLANKYANGEELDPSVFNGGAETNSYLESRGFRVVNVSSPGKPLKISIGPTIIPEQPHEVRKSKHDERCPECKKIVEAMLRKLYGVVESNYKFTVGAHIEDYRGRPFYSDLEKIFTDLQNYRGYKSFVGTSTLPRCDYFIPNPGFLVEFDESQHFTIPRKRALLNYPDSLKLGFFKEKWINLCSKIQATDNDPCYRDEQRAWYDTLRDFLPEIEGLAPTVRLYSKDMRWCSLDPDRRDDVKRFQNLIESRQIGSEGDFIAVVIIESESTGPEDQRQNGPRLNALIEIIERVAEEMNGDGVILLPGGYYSSGEKPGKTEFNKVENEISEVLRTIKQNIIVCLGIDGTVFGTGKERCAHDQLAIAVGKEGITSIGRKFYPTGGEEGVIQLADDHNSLEEGCSRVFVLNGVSYYLAVCYDVFGIKHQALANPGVNVVLDLIHSFFPVGEGPSGVSLFTRHGIAGASRQWDCPIFGTAVFFNRNVPEDWPSGMYWNQGSKNTKQFSYTDNPIKEFNSWEHKIPTISVFPEGKALIKLYSIQDSMMK